jgi:DNA polymerase III delta' subunit
VDGFRTRGQPVAVAAIRAMLGSGFPHAILLAGPAGVGKTTLALDIAAALLCTADDPSSRPCRTCRGCRMVEHGNHPDVHRLAPLGAGALIPIGGREDRGVRDLVGELSLMPVEGGARVAIVERAERMTEDAQSALLKTLEEPPARTTIILATDDEERVLPTIRSRSARVRLGPVGPREVEAVLVAQGVADAPTAARLARITDGRPGHAIAYARAPEAVVLRGEIARTLLDLHRAGLTARLTGLRELAVRASDMIRAIEAGTARAALDGGAPPAGAVAGSRGRGRSRKMAGVLVATAALAGPSASNAGTAPQSVPDERSANDAEPADDRTARVPAAERRLGALALLQIWRGLVRDLGLVVVGEPGAVRDQDLMDDLVAAAGEMTTPAIGAALGRLDVAAECLEGNVSPELVLDVLAIHWAPAGAR